MDPFATLDAADSLDPNKSDHEPQHPLSVLDAADALEDAAAPKPSSIGKFLQMRKALGETVLHYGTGTVGALGGGLNFLGTLAASGGNIDAAKAVQEETEDKLTYEPRTDSGKALSYGVGQLIGLPQRGVDWLADRAAEGPTQEQLKTLRAIDPIGVALGKYSPSPLLATALHTAPSALISARALGGILNKPRVTASPSDPMPAEPAASPEPMAGNLAKDIPIDSQPIEGGLPKELVNDRAAILRRVGVDTARTSALEGNEKAAATDFQLSKFDEPAGDVAKSQFNAERAALESHAQKIIDKTGGTFGLDEDRIHSRGQTMATPFDELGNHLDKQMKQLYREADQRSLGMPSTKLNGVDDLLNNPEFRNELLGKNQGPLLNAVEAQLGEFRKNLPSGRSISDVKKDMESVSKKAQSLPEEMEFDSPEHETLANKYDLLKREMKEVEQGKSAGEVGFTPHGAEQFRQWLNKLWTPDNSEIIGQLKGEVDDNVMKDAGEDIYSKARKIRQVRAQTLENPNGIAKIMETDPRTPINRVTPYVKIPDTVTRLDPDQFRNVVDTLKGMPTEVQPSAQAALSEIKSHLMNKIYNAGSKTQGQWNAPAVSEIIKANKAKIQIAFAGDEEALQSIADLESAGKIMHVNAAYPGAAAQAANALKRGMMSNVIQHIGGVSGAAIGASGGPLIAAGSAVAGEAIGSFIGRKASEASAVKKWQKGTLKLTDKLND